MPTQSVITSHNNRAGQDGTENVAGLNLQILPYCSTKSTFFFEENEAG